MYKIKEVAKMLGVSTATLRYYEQEGILPNIKRVNGIRVFNDEDFKWLRVLNCMKKINMPIKKIKEYIDLAMMGDSTLKERYHLILEQKEFIKAEIAKLNNCLKEFEYKEWYYKTAIKAGTEAAVKNMPKSSPTLEIDEIPVKIKRKDL